MTEISYSSITTCGVPALGPKANPGARINVMKIDVEGHELEVISGALATIARDAPTIYVEVSRENATHLRALMESLGYAVELVWEAESGAFSYCLCSKISN